MSLVLLSLFAVPCAYAGAWGYGAFENDDALDWLAELESTSGTQLLEATVRQVDTRAKYVEAPICSIALAAAEVIAAASGHAGKNLPIEVTAWVKRARPAVGATLRAEARASVEKCRDSKNSELRELWQESKDEKLWLQDTADLIARLAGASSKNLLERTRER